MQRCPHNWDTWNAFLNEQYRGSSAIELRGFAKKNKCNIEIKLKLIKLKIKKNQQINDWTKLKISKLNQN